VRELTTVADDLAVIHEGTTVHRYDGLEPDTGYTFFGLAVRTLPRPPGELLCRLATVNDVHFGEVEAGRIDDDPRGPIFTVAPGEPPYPETMNRAAVREMSAIHPAAVIVKGDLTRDGEPDELQAFLDCYGTFGERLHAVRGNHDAYHGQTYASGDALIDLPGVRVALLDTVIPGETTGHVTPAQLEWLDAAAADADRPVLAMGHHQNWMPENGPSDDYFGIDPTSSQGLIDVMARRPGIAAYLAGHTHRHRVRRTPATGMRPYIEVGTVKDFPGTWAEYRVYEGGILQVVHRISDPAALAWSERCRHLFAEFHFDYAPYALGALDDRCLVVALP
jgi:3',5'-cyclic-AMP phosphodiesterase